MESLIIQQSSGPKRESREIPKRVHRKGGKVMKDHFCVIGPKTGGELLNEVAKGDAFRQTIMGEAMTLSILPCV